MSGMGRWVSSHVGVVVVMLLLLAFVVAGSVVRCTAIHAPQEVERTQEDLADEELSGELRALRKTYTDVTKEAVGLLAANVWVDATGTSVVEPTERAVLTRSQGDETWEAYVVRASARRTVTEDGTTSTVTTLCLQTPEWCDLATVTLPSASGQNEAPQTATLWCPAICGGSELTLSPALKQIEVEGPSEEILSARGTSLAKVRGKMAEWCGTWRPTATTATWGKIVEEDHEERTYKLYYKLDDSRGTSVTLSIGMDDGKLAVEEGGRQ
jgi:hypothetical protein